MHTQCACSDGAIYYIDDQPHKTQHQAARLITKPILFNVNSTNIFRSIYYKIVIPVHTRFICANDLDCSSIIMKLDGPETSILITYWSEFCVFACGFSENHTVFSVFFHLQIRPSECSIGSTCIKLNYMFNAIMALHFFFHYFCCFQIGWMIKIHDINLTIWIQSTLLLPVALIWLKSGIQLLLFVLLKNRIKFILTEYSLHSVRYGTLHRYNSHRWINKIGYVHEIFHFLNLQ